MCISCRQDVCFLLLLQFVVVHDSQDCSRMFMCSSRVLEQFAPTFFRLFIPPRSGANVWERCDQAQPSAPKAVAASSSSRRGRSHDAPPATTEPQTDRARLHGPDASRPRPALPSRKKAAPPATDPPQTERTPLRSPALGRKLQQKPHPQPVDPAPLPTSPLRIALSPRESRRRRITDVYEQGAEDASRFDRERLR